MKRKILSLICILIFTSVLFVSCAGERKAWSQSATYKDPQTIGGYWDVTMQTGQTFNHVKCVYWGVDDDTAVFKMDDGTLVCQSGACVCIESK